MKDGHCPKCNSSEVYRGTQSPVQAGDSLVHLVAYARNTGFNLLLDAYVCANCGYVELYVAEGSKVNLGVLSQDHKTWQKVG